MKENVKNNKKIAKIKSNAIKLRADYMIPSELCYQITRLDKNSSIELINYLIEQSNHMMRVKGYYKKYKEIENSFNQIIKSYFKERR